MCGEWVFKSFVVLSHAVKTSLDVGSTSRNLEVGRSTSLHHSSTRGVKFEVLSSSRGSGLIGRAIFPLLAPAQLRYFREQVRCMQEGSRVH